MAGRDRDLVWSSSDGDLRKARRHTPPAPAGGGGRVKVRREVAGRRGKAVTTISDVPLDDAGLRELAGRTGADELMISASTHGVRERVRSLELLAAAWGLRPAEERAAA